MEKIIMEALVENNYKYCYYGIRTDSREFSVGDEIGCSRNLDDTDDYLSLIHILHRLHRHGCSFPHCHNSRCVIRPHVTQRRVVSSGLRKGIADERGYVLFEGRGEVRWVDVAYGVGYVLAGSVDLDELPRIV